MTTMTADELRSAIDTLWDGNQSRAARDLGINARQIRAYLTAPENNSHRPIPAVVADDIRGFLEMFPNGVQHIDVIKSIDILHRRMVDAGWSETMAAGSILGAAHALAVRTLGRDEVADLLGG